MARRCQVTGRSPGTGRNVSHSHVRTPRRFGVNVQDRRYWAPSLGRHVRLRLSAKGIKVVDRDGIDAVVARLRAAGEKV
ncbi:LSU ribosomal protein L28P [Actinomycetospora succinea]|uniref:Large ribosomal subunit protein bL28 n=1 Tax=Actinomycetospora succinea TaxID=663603 RepID=A0A4R6VSA3_9PSEU|nr:50S ribosomal protein L28 [Actinomycetospora succinea]TDQ65360.1 LSU ribosomal protein L28P [Actinomycetospora succinea]